MLHFDPARIGYEATTHTIGVLAGCGVPLAAVDAAGGSAVGAAAISQGLATLGMGGVGVLGLSAMMTGVGVAAGIGLGTYVTAVFVLDHTIGTRIGRDGDDRSSEAISTPDEASLATAGAEAVGDSRPKTGAADRSPSFQAPLGRFRFGRGGLAALARQSSVSGHEDVVGSRPE